tara:strand:- start:269 stop:700 length:432 start_codon:yes stop_codon:yes gene_type:complete
MGNIRITKYFRWILGAVLAAAGILKIIDPENMIEVLLFFGVYPESTAKFLVYAAATTEIILAIYLFRQVQKKLIHLLVALLCGFFLLIALVGYSNGWEFACGCLGRFSFGRFDLQMVLRNAVLAIMSGWMYYQTKKEVKLGVS